MRPKERGGRLIGTGIILMVLAPLMMAGGLVWGVSRTGDGFHQVLGGTFLAFKGETVRLYTHVDSESGGGATCRVHSDGALVFEGRAHGVPIVRDGHTYVPVGAFDARLDDNYRISCGGRPVLAQVDDGYPPRRLMSGGVGFGAGTLCGAVVGISGLILVIVGAARRRRSGREIIAWDRTHRPMPGSGHERYPGGPRVPPAYVNPPGDPFRAPPA